MKSMAALVLTSMLGVAWAQGPGQSTVSLACSPPVTLSECKAMENTTERLVRAYRRQLPKEWSWWVVPNSKWSIAVGPAAKKTTLAVTDPVDGVTVINLELFRLENREVLRFALAHEASHIICQFDMRHEEAANEAARRLLNGSQTICGQRAKNGSMALVR